MYAYLRKDAAYVRLFNKFCSLGVTELVRLKNVSYEHFSCGYILVKHSYIKISRVDHGR